MDKSIKEVHEDIRMFGERLESLISELAEIQGVTDLRLCSPEGVKARIRK